MDDANFAHWMHGLTEDRLLHFLLLMKMELKHREAAKRIPESHPASRVQG